MAHFHAHWDDGWSHRDGDVTVTGGRELLRGSPQLLTLKAAVSTPVRRSQLESVHKCEIFLIFYQHLVTRSLWGALPTCPSTPPFAITEKGNVSATTKTELDQILPAVGPSHGSFGLCLPFYCAFQLRMAAPKLLSRLNSNSITLSAANIMSCPIRGKLQKSGRV